MAKRGADVRRVDLGETPLVTIQTVIASLTDETAWVSGCTYTDNHVRVANIESIAACFVDVDYKRDGQKARPQEEERAAIEHLLRRAGAQVYHHTQHGVRLAYVLEEPRPAEDAARLCKAAATMARRKLEDAPAGYHCDTCSNNPAQVYYGPRGFPVRLGFNRRLWAPSRLLEELADDEEAQAVEATDEEARQLADGAFRRARDRWVEDHPREYPEQVSRCPVCGHNGCFKVLRDEPTKWICYSTNHSGAGHQTRDGETHVGDALDIACHERGLSPREVLTADGYLVQSSPLAWTDISLRDDFLRAHGEDVRRCYMWGAWFVWDGYRWRKDERCEVRARVVDVCDEASQRAIDDEGGARFARGLASDRQVGNVERLVQCHPSVATVPDQWDDSPWLLATPGGTVDLTTGELRPSQRGELLSKSTSVAPEHGRAVMWESFLRRVLGQHEGLVEYFQRFFGYCLTGSTREHVFAFLYGSGGNGKGVALNTLDAIFGDYRSVCDVETLTASNSTEHPTSIAKLRGARLVTAQETEEGRAWAEAKIKSLTGGDTLTARYMRCDHFEFVPEFKLVIAGNHKPKLRNVDDAIRRRLHLVPFDAVIAEDERDPELTAKLKAEHGRILRWAIDGCLEWQKQGLNPPKAVRAATEEYFEEQDSFSQWVEECLEMDEHSRESVSALMQSWREFAVERNLFVGDARKLKANFERKNIFQSRSRTSRGYSGIRIR